jgi:hypothetical protein
MDDQKSREYNLVAIPAETNHAKMALCHRKWEWASAISFLRGHLMVYQRCSNGIGIENRRKAGIAH